MKGLRRYVEDLLKGRRPRSFPVEEADADALRLAIELRAARPGSDAPREEFVADLHRRLAEPDIARAPMPVGRRLVLGGAFAATGAVAGASIDHALTRGATPPGDGTLSPNRGRWHPVADAADLPDGAVRSFDAGSVTGFVTRDSGRLRAVSGVCTHQGCRLHVEGGARLRCPCHQALFALDGAVVHHRLPAPIPALPRLAVREAGGVVQVYVSSA
ncbi:Rieske (2Fe-2S) protein [Actinoallomurus purpureus]|uniref:Rieske (2Fe-2S) protein n=1 Tax=Actinoallomurus purpureus TaxID=478114 RepID=UPI0020932DCC|nr:Rieske (2Fe-2S) protein [Actinoallomurus purpureus]MCO6003597.1 Rieske (2Fe-2S) protein [Actinoallomurus purpureus]